MGILEGGENGRKFRGEEDDAIGAHRERELVWKEKRCDAEGEAWVEVTVEARRKHVEGGREHVA